MNDSAFISPVGQRLVLLVAGMLVLVGFSVAGLLVSRAQAMEKRLLQRREGVMHRHVRIQQPIDMQLFARAPGAEATLKYRAAGWFGVDLDRPDICPVPWWVVVAFGAVAAWVATWCSGLLVGPVSWVGFIVEWMFASRFGFAYFQGRRRAKLLTQFPDSLMMIVRAIRVGVPVTEAIHIVAHEQQEPTASEFAMLGNQLAIGEPLDRAVLSMAKHADLAEYRFFATALALQSKSGGALSGTLESLAEMIRKRLAVKQRAIALASEARMSIYVLTGLPMLVALALSALNPAYISLLLSDPTGNKILTAACMSLTIGWGSMQYIVKKSSS